MMIQFIYSIIISLSISLFFTPIVRNLFIKYNFVENPIEKNKKTNNATALSPVPRGGGIPIFIAIFFTSLLFLPLDKHLKGILLAVTLTLIIGVWDDLKDISPKIRLITNIISALIVVGSGIGIAFVSNPFGGIIDLSYPRFSFNLFGLHSIWIISDILAVIWIVWCQNIVGWSTGVDGQLPGFVSISAFFIGLLGLRFATDITQWPVIILAGVVCGSYLGFLPFNIFPQSIMPGYSGKSIAGLLLAVLAILSGAKLATLIFLLGIPMIDAVFVLIKRIINKKPLTQSDGNHLHHQLLKTGWSRHQIAIFYWFISLFLGILVLFLNSHQKFYVFIGIIILFIAFTLQLSRRTY
jgi:UDP-GlcNAc:undecaprenyl-phosphate/decaprenyl-phosphate GlcNAc-1-phosphate transferase